MDLKEPLSYSAQIDKLKLHGMIITDEERVKQLLSQINYYRFTGYALLEAVIEEYKEDIDLARIGFPSDYDIIMKNSI